MGNNSERKGLKALKIFVSYGHDKHSEIVKKLADAVEEKSNGTIEVWIDHKKIERNSHWREAITKGILKSDGVLAFLSEYSTREKGVCLDELAIAITSKHGMIRTILLESSDSFTPPSLVSEYQWGDMSNYQEIKKQGEDAFEKYINKEAQLIVDMLQSDEIKKYNEEIEEVRKILHMPAIEDLNKFDLLLSNEMFGREWLKEEVSQWIENSNSKQIMMLYGKPGAGKSMFAAHLQHYNPNVVAAFPCNYNSEKYSSTNNIILQITYKLALRLPDYRRWLLENAKDEFFKIGSGHDLFVNLIANPLSHCIDGERASMVIIIDAIDEAANDEIAKFIVEYVPLMKKWVKFLITSRKESRIMNRFRVYQEIDIDKNEQNNRKDLRIYYHARLGEKLSSWDGYDVFLDRLVEHSEGVFAYAKCVCENIIEDVEDFCFEKLSDYKIPRGLSALFMDTMDRKFNSSKAIWNRRDYVEFWQKPLGIIIASPEPIEVKTLKKLVNWNQNDYSKFINAMSTLVLEANGKLMPFHKSFAEWLDTELSDYSTSKQAGEKTIVEICCALYHMNPEYMDDYMLLYYPKLLFKMEGFEKEKSELLRDVAYWNKIIGVAEEYRKNNYFFKAEAYCKCYIDINSIIVNQKFNDQKLVDDHKSIYGLAMFNMGQICQNRKQFQEALQYFEKSLKIRTGLMKKYPKQISLWSEVAISQDSMGDIYMALGKKGKAKEYYDSSLKICEKFCCTFPNESALKRNLCVSWIKLGELEEKNMDIEKTIQYYKNAVKVSKELLEADPENRKLKEDLCNVLLRIAEFYTSRTGFMEGIKKHLLNSLYEEPLKYARDLYELDSTNAEYARLLCIALNGGGKLFAKRKNLEESIKIVQQLCERFPENIDFVTLKMHTELKLAMKIQLEGEFDAALVIYKQCYETVSALCEKYPQNLDYKQDRAAVLVNLANDSEDMQEVEQYFKEAITLYQQLIDKYPDNITLVRDMCYVLEELGKFCARVKNDMEECDYYFERAKRLMQNLCKRYPKKKELEFELIRLKDSRMALH